MKLRGIIFDCDGVLAETELDGHLAAFNQAFRDLNLPVQWTPEEYSKLLRIGGGKERLATLFDNLAFDNLGHREGDRRRLLERWHRVKTERFISLVRAGAVPARQGVRRLAAEAVRRGLRVAVASTSSQGAVREVLTHVVGSDLAPAFEVYAGDIVDRKKPAPDIYLVALACMQLSSDECVAIEDSGIGCRSAVAAGLSTLITRSYFSQEDAFPGAAEVVGDLDRSTTAGPAIDVEFLNSLLSDG